MAGGHSEPGALYGRCAADVLRLSGSNTSATIEHDDMVTKQADQPHVLTSEQYCNAALLQFEQVRGQLVAFAWVKADLRFIHAKQFWAHRCPAGNFQPPLHRRTQFARFTAGGVSQSHQVEPVSRAFGGFSIP